MVVRAALTFNYKKAQELFEEKRQGIYNNLSKYISMDSPMSLKEAILMQKVLVGVDGSERSKKASKKAAELLEDAEVTLVSVIEGAVKEEHIREKVLEMLNTEAAFFREKGLDVKKEIHYGDPADVLCELAEDNDFELIVLADKGHGVKRFLLGSTTDRVVRHAKTSVLVVK